MFGAFVFAPKRQGNTVPLFLDGGFVLYGPMSKRPKDFGGVAVVYGAYSADMAAAAGNDVPNARSAVSSVRDFEMTLEATYGLELLPGLVLQPDLQYIIHPSGKSSIPNALAIGLNVVVLL
jgi:porin